MNILKLERNNRGNDYIVGDIHGHFDEFDALLQKLKFNPDTDRMISVGDHIDRGPNNERSLYYLAQPWFYSVRGNHEAMLISSYYQKPGVFDVWMRNGGEWARKLSADELKKYVDVYERMPYMIHIDSDHGPVGVVHADLPTDYTWQELLTKAESGNLTEREQTVMLWSRATYQKLRLWILYPGLYHEKPVEGAHKIYIGHSIVAMPITFGNFVFIDTGAYAGGCLTAVNVNTEEMVSVPSAKTA